MKKILFILVSLFIVGSFITWSCNRVSLPPMVFTPKPQPVENLKVPEGFTVSYFAKEVKNARAMCLGDKGTVFVGSRKEGKVYAVIDKNNDFQAEEVLTIISGLGMPTGITYKDGALYVAEVSKIWRYDDIENQLKNPPKPVLICGDLPTETHHGWKYLGFGPDGKLYVPVGAPCNICLSSQDERFASILRMNADGSDVEVFAHGVRNSVGFDWHPETKELWFTENGRDWMGDDIPPCELNRAPTKGLHFGYPFCHGGTIADDEFGDQKNCDEFTPPVQNLIAHVAPLGMHFYTGKMFPQKYQNQIFIAEHGSWNRSKKSGYKVTLVNINEESKATNYTPFITGWLPSDNDAKGKVWGRPVDILQLKDGSLLVSDDLGGGIFRVSWE